LPAEHFSMTNNPRISRPELTSRLQILMFLRVLLVSLLLGASVLIQIRETRTYFGYIQSFHFFLLAAVFLLTFIYIVILKNVRNLLLFAYVQLFVDSFIITAIIYSTGGVDSIFSFLYILDIIGASIILYRRGAILIASSSSILFGLLLDFQFFEWIHPLGTRAVSYSVEQRMQFFFLALVNMAAFYLVAFLSSFLSEQVRKSRAELRAKQTDLDQLEILKDSIINSISSGLIALDAGARVILFNPAAEEMFSKKSSACLGESIHELLPGIAAYFSHQERTSELTLPLGVPFADIPYKRPGQKPLHLRLSISPLQFGTDLEQGHILVFQDMTSIRKIEQKMKKVEGLALIGELAAGIAHEIRNPMASISGSIQMIKGRLDKDDIDSRLMEIVLREIKRLNELVNDFLLFARPKKAKLRAFDLSDVILESLELFQNSQHWNEGIRVLPEISEHLKLISDPELVKQILWNLFVNAFEAMPTGGSLQIKATKENGPEESPDDQGWMRIVVRDTGDGFDESAMSHLFTPFFTTKEEGSGLGLAIVKRVVDTLHGEAFGENHPDGGAEVTILLPSLSGEGPDDGAHPRLGVGKSRII
jgi:two-component system sensor histidine kinase PilS (NtrC family)